MGQFKKQYPSWKSRRQVSEIYDSLLSSSTLWEACKSKFGRLRYLEEESITVSLRELAFNNSISISKFDTYLKLLRPSPTHVEIINSIKQSQYETVLAGLDRMKVWIVPVEGEISWSFYVVRPDGEHWYNQGLLPADKSTMTSFNNPSKDVTAAYVLLGIRLLSQGLPQMDSKTIEKNISQWQTRLLVELACEEIDPTNESVKRVCYIIESILGREKELESSYFDDACGDLLLDDAPNVVYSPTISDDGSGCTSSDARGTALNRKYRSCVDPCRETTKPPQESVDIKNIMEVLSDATIATRCMGPASKNDLPALCNIVSGKRIENYFQVRCCRQQIYDKVLRDTDGGLKEIRRWTERIGNTSIRQSFTIAIEDECRQWAVLRQWCQNEGCSEAALLCAIPKTGVWSAPCLQRLHERLQHSNDSLRHLLKDAEGLSEALMASNLPIHTLCIELYPGKRAEVFTRDAFTAFVSVDNNPVIPLERVDRGVKRKKVSVREREC